MKRKILLSILAPLFGYGILFKVISFYMVQSYQICIDERRVQTACDLQFLMTTEDWWSKRSELPSIASEMMKDCGPMPIWEPILKRIALGEKYETAFQSGNGLKHAQKDYLALIHKGQTLPLGILEKYATTEKSVGFLGKVSAWNHWIEDLTSVVARQRSITWDHLKTSLLNSDLNSCTHQTGWQSLSVGQISVVAVMLILLFSVQWAIIFFF